MDKNSFERIKQSIKTVIENDLQFTSKVKECKEQDLDNTIKSKIQNKNDFKNSKSQKTSKTNRYNSVTVNIEQSNQNESNEMRDVDKEPINDEKLIFDQIQKSVNNSQNLKNNDIIYNNNSNDFQNKSQNNYNNQINTSQNQHSANLYQNINQNNSNTSKTNNSHLPNLSESFMFTQNKTKTSNKSKLNVIKLSNLDLIESTQTQSQQTQNNNQNQNMLNEQYSNRSDESQINKSKDMDMTNIVKEEQFENKVQRDPKTICSQLNVSFGKSNISGIKGSQNYDTIYEENNETQDFSMSNISKMDQDQFHRLNNDLSQFLENDSISNTNSLVPEDFKKSVDQLNIVVKTHPFFNSIDLTMTNNETRFLIEMNRQYLSTKVIYSMQLHYHRDSVNQNGIPKTLVEFLDNVLSPTHFLKFLELYREMKETQPILDQNEIYQNQEEQTSNKQIEEMQNEILSIKTCGNCDMNEEAILNSTCVINGAYYSNQLIFLDDCGHSVCLGCNQGHSIFKCFKCGIDVSINIQFD